MRKYCTGHRLMKRLNYLPCLIDVSATYTVQCAYIGQYTTISLFFIYSKGITHHVRILNDYTDWSHLWSLHTKCTGAGRVALSQIKKNKNCLFYKSFEKTYRLYNFFLFFFLIWDKATRPAPVNTLVRYPLFTVWHYP